MAKDVQGMNWAQGRKGKNYAKKESFEKGRSKSQD